MPVWAIRQRKAQWLASTGEMAPHFVNACPVANLTFTSGCQSIVSVMVVEAVMDEDVSVPEMVKA
jgi:hypothetical protein